MLRTGQGERVDVNRCDAVLPALVSATGTLLLTVRLLPGRDSGRAF